MSFADEVEPTKTGGRRCVTCVFLETLDPKVADDVRAVIADRTYGSQAIHNALVRAHGYRWTYSAFMKHRTNHG